MKATCIAALLLLGAVCAWAGGKDDEYANEATALGDYDSSTQISLHTKTLTLVLPALEEGLVASVGGNVEDAGSTALFQYNIVCGEGKYAEVVGNCAETSIYLVRQPYARQQVNTQVSCDITKKCAALNNLVGSINGQSRAPSGVWADDEFPVTLSVTSGTGDFSHVIGGSMSFYKEDVGFTVKVKTLYWTKSKAYYNKEA